MPELPEVECIVRALAPHVRGKTIRRSELFDPRLPENIPPSALISALQGKTVENITRRGKFILFGLDNGARLTAHLRMTGKYFFFESLTAPDKHTRLVLTFNDDSQLHYRDMRRFGKMAYYPAGAKIPALDLQGAEPLEGAFTPEYLAQKTTCRKTAVKQLLLDQRVIAGIGNIYASEILHRARVNPLKRSCEVDDGEVARLVEATRDILRQAIQCRGTTIIDFATPEGGKGRFQDRLKVYGREGLPCPQCGTPIKRIVQGQRSTFYCPLCQG